MFFICRYYEPGEKVVCRNKIRIWPLIWNAFLFAGAAGLMLLMFYYYLPVLSPNTFDFGARSSYDLLNLYILIFPMGVVGLLALLFNRIVITNRRVYIRSGLAGTLEIIEISDIAAFGHEKGTADTVYFILKNGEGIETASLTATKKSMTQVVDTLYRLAGPRIADENIPKFSGKAADSKISTIRNILFPALWITPFVIAVFMFIAANAGLNYTGRQTEIRIEGMVKEKSFSHSIRMSRNYYSFVVTEARNQKEWDIPVSWWEYKRFETQDPIVIHAKRGSLGFIYEDTYEKGPRDRPAQK
ncbi:MAG: hypothetical protein ACM3QZ_09500 [Solirubrobacterales bacterium]